MENRMKLLTLTPEQEKEFNRLREDIMPRVKTLCSTLSWTSLGLICFNDLVAEFDLKIIHNFQKYTDEGLSYRHKKAKILNSITVFRNRLSKNSKQAKYELFQARVEIDDVQIADEDIEHGSPVEFEEVYAYLKEILSPDARLVLETELSYPPYIQKRVNPNSKAKKLPCALVGMYLEYGNDTAAQNKVKKLRKEIDQAIIKTREYFNDQQPNSH